MAVTYTTVTGAQLHMLIMAPLQLLDEFGSLSICWSQRVVNVGFQSRGALCGPDLAQA